MRRVRKKSFKTRNIQILKSRINIIILIAFLMCLILVLRLAYLQIVKAESYQTEIENAQYIEINQSVPRGEIYDRNGNLLVGNQSKRSIFFTRHRNMDFNEIFNIASELSNYIEIDTTNNALRDKQDYIINNYYAIVEDLLPEETQLLKDGNIDRQSFNESVYEKLTKETADEILTEEDQKIIAIYSRMINARELHPTVIKNNDVSEEEFARVSENTHELTGISTGMDWEREYPYESTLKTLFGEVSSQSEGLPKELLNHYLSLGYSRNDRVGKSYLEYQYESVLRGNKEVVKYTTDKSGRIINQEIFKKGQPGNNIYLTIDINLQLELEKIAEYHLTELRNIAEEVQRRGKNDENFDYNVIPEHLNTVLLVVQDPNNGDILALVGKKINDDGDIVDYHYGTFTSTYAVGSSIKGATIAVGYQEDSIEVGEVINDEPLVFADNSVRTSFFNRNNVVPISDVQALMVSSNVYMYKTALRIAGTPYTENMSYPTNIREAGQTLRNGFEEFGLGVSTGLDVPNEDTGISPEFTTNPGNYLDFAIGQYDTYSAVQLSQYVSTIANEGNRMKLHLLKEVRENIPNEESRVLSSNPVRILNTLNNSKEELATIREGFYHVYNTYDEENNRYGTGWDAFHDLDVTSAGKTGTAEAFYKGNPVLNQTYVGYTPYDKPEMAFSIIFPNMPYTIPFFPTQYMGRDVINKYHEVINNQQSNSLYQYDIEYIYQRLLVGSY